MDGSLLKEEEELARQGQFNSAYGLQSIQADCADWEEAIAETAKILSLSETPSIPFPSASQPSTSAAAAGSAAAAEEPAAKKGKGRGKSKRKAEADEPEADEEAEAKKAKVVEGGETDGQAGAELTATDEATKQAALAAAAFFGLFDPASLRMPEVPTKEQMADVLLEVRKKALREEYGV